MVEIQVLSQLLGLLRELRLIHHRTADGVELWDDNERFVRLISDASGEKLSELRSNRRANTARGALC